MLGKYHVISGSSRLLQPAAAYRKSSTEGLANLVFFSSNCEVTALEPISAFVLEC
jgi:hypothetical protein